MTDRHLECLAFIFKENHLANALELVQLGRVKRLVAERSGRSAFQVQGKSSSSSSSSSLATGAGGTGTTRKPGGLKAGAEEYLCFPSHYCSCRAFQWDVISRGEQLICKHQLAARIAEATGLHANSVVSDLLLAQLLEAYMRRGTGGWGGGGGGGGGSWQQQHRSTGPPPTFYGN